MRHDFDVIIVGAGIAGSALACSLSSGFYAATKGLRIALVEAHKVSDKLPAQGGEVKGFDARVSALTRASIDYFEKLGVWSAMTALRSCPFVGMQVWDARGTGEINFDAQAMGVGYLGHIVENRVITAALMSAVREQRVEILDGCAVSSIMLPKAGERQQADGGAQVTLNNGSRMTADLVVAADGAHSPCRQMLGMPVRAWDYQQDAIVCTVAVSQPHQYTAWQTFTGTGPLAYLPLMTEPKSSDHVGPHYCSIVWSQTRERAEQLLALPEAEFCQQLASALEFRLGDVVAVSRRQSFSLQQQHAIDYVHEGFALIADAAHTIHPLAGQGINLGIGDVQELAQTIAMATADGAPLGELARLQRYQRARKTDNLAMMAVVEGFKRLYEPVPLPVMWLRNWGMQQVNSLPWLKNKILKYAMGLG